MSQPCMPLIHRISSPPPTTSGGGRATLSTSSELENEKGRTEAEPKNKKKTRGPSKGLALDAYVLKNGRHQITVDEKYQRPILASDSCTAYCCNVGFVIRDRVPVLWAEWKDVPQCVKEALNNAMSVQILEE
ncbi:hypothetical protein OROMI_013573 [Orobanche minor]